MSTALLPGMGSMSALSCWIEKHEQLLAGDLLINDAANIHGNGFCAIFMSRSADGQFILRMCEGSDDAWLIWREQRTVRSFFGQSYAQTLLNRWLRQKEREGYTVEWSVRHQSELPLEPVLNAA